MNEKLNEFLKKVAVDDGLVAKLKECKVLDEAYELASEAVGGFSKEEFEAGMKKIDEYFKRASSDELSDDDLASVSGGVIDPRSVITNEAQPGTVAAAATAAV